jgi:myo-inositol-1(or 4)-monophosphatase
VAEGLPPIFLATAIEVVMQAGAMQLAGSGDLHIEKKGTIDLVTEIDKQVEQMFRALIGDRFPDHSILAEEFAAQGDRDHDSRYCWVFDPVDGTTNYAHGLPIFCSAASLEIDRQPVVAAVYDPSRRELFTAERGVGAWLNGTPIHVSGAAALIDALLCTGFPYSVQQDPDELVALFGEFLKCARAVRRLGSAALDMCYVAAGRLDGFWEQKLQPWDVSAGALIVLEAGGTVTNLEGGAFDSRRGAAVASNGRIHAAMVETIQGFKARFRSRNWTK